jgi:TPR repeat protein
MRKIMGLALWCGMLFMGSAQAQPAGGSIPVPDLPADHIYMPGKANCSASSRLDLASQNPCDWFLLAIAYQQGRGVPKDHPRSLDYLMRAAKANHASAQMGLSEAYEHGFGGLQPNMAGAFHWMLIAAQQKHPQAAEHIGEFMVEGKGTPKDPAGALYWFQEALDRGRSSAAADIGLIHFEGMGVPRDSAKAVQYWRLGSDDGDITSMAFLGDAYRMGEGVPFDTRQARHWLGKARAGGSKYAVKVLAYIDEVDRKYANMRPARTSGSSGSAAVGPSISEQAMETHRRQARENCAAALKGANRLCVLP